MLVAAFSLVNGISSVHHKCCDGRLSGLALACVRARRVRVNGIPVCVPTHAVHGSRYACGCGAHDNTAPSEMKKTINNVPPR